MEAKMLDNNLIEAKHTSNLLYVLIAKKSMIPLGLYILPLSYLKLSLIKNGSGIQNSPLSHGLITIAYLF
jgi:hypothetical protein